MNDWDSMVKLFVQIARKGHEYVPGHRALKIKLQDRYEKFKTLLLSPPDRARPGQRESSET